MSKAETASICVCLVHLSTSAIAPTNVNQMTRDLAIHTTRVTLEAIGAKLCWYMPYARRLCWCPGSQTGLFWDRGT